MINNELILSMESKNTKEIEAAPNGEPLVYQDLNEEIHEAINDGFERIVLNDVCGQRFIGAALQGDLEIL